MKKLLLSLGAVATVVAPVAIVVSCNKDKDDKNSQALATNGTKISTEADLDAILLKAKYSLSDIEKAKLFDALKDSTVVASYQGTGLDKSHDSNDFALLVKSDKRDSAVSILGDTNLTAFNTKGNGGVTDSDQVVHTPSSWTQRWGMTEAKFNEATKMVFFQKDDTNTNVSYTSIVKLGNTLYQDELTTVELAASAI